MVGHDFTEMFGAFFALINPFVNLPIFLALTNGLTVPEQRVLALKITMFSAVMCAIILVAGGNIISFFGVSLDQFRIAGGAVLAQIAWSLLNGGSVASHQGSDKEREAKVDLSTLAFYPMTFPMIVGPGTIATLIIYSGRAKGPTEMLQIGAIIGAVLLILMVVLFFASAFGKVLSNTMRVIMSRLMGMILLSIAVEMIVDGLWVIFPAWAATS